MVPGFLWNIHLPSTAQTPPPDFISPTGERKYMFDVTASLCPPPSPPPAACQSTCSTCSSRWDCQSCGSQKPLLSAERDQCLTSCPPGSYQHDQSLCRREYRPPPPPPPPRGFMCSVMNCLLAQIQPHNQSVSWSLPG